MSPENCKNYLVEELKLSAVPQDCRLIMRVEHCEKGRACNVPKLCPYCNFFRSKQVSARHPESRLKNLEAFGQNIRNEVVIYRKKS